MNTCCRSRSASPNLRLGVIGLIALLMLGGWIISSTAAPADAETEVEEPQRLAVLWTSGDPEVAHRVTLMYTEAAGAQRWFDEVRLIIWGPSQRLLVSDGDVQAAMADIQDAGVQVDACIMCAESYGITDQLRDLGLTVEGMGMPLTEHLKDDDWEVLTF